MNQKTAEALKIFEKVYESTRQILDDAGIPANMIEVYTAKIPRFDRMFPEEVVEVFQSIKRATIVYLYQKGFSHREIARRLAGSSTPVIRAEIEKYEKGKNENKGTDN